MATKPISPDFPKNTPAQKVAWAKYAKDLAAYDKQVGANTNRALKDEGTVAARLAAKKKAAATAAAKKKRSKDMTTGKKPFYGFDGNPMGYKGPIE